jgi:hypothetical protein
MYWVVMFSPNSEQHLNISHVHMLCCCAEISRLEFWEFYFSLYFAPFRRGNKLFTAEQASREAESCEATQGNNADVQQPAMHTSHTSHTTTYQHLQSTSTVNTG